MRIGVMSSAWQNVAKVVSGEPGRNRARSQRAQRVAARLKACGRNQAEGARIGEPGRNRIKERRFRQHIDGVRLLVLIV